MEQYLLDTDVISNFLSNSLSESCSEFICGIINETPNISIITEIELLCWDTDGATYDKITSFISECNVEQITNNVVIRCVEIRKGRKIKTPDAIIAATALAMNYTLLTGNVDDFQNIRGLRVIDSGLL